VQKKVTGCYRGSPSFQTGAVFGFMKVRGGGQKNLLPTGILNANAAFKAINDSFNLYIMAFTGAPNLFLLFHNVNRKLPDKNRPLLFRFFALPS
jgi:hypothetical protein